MVKIKATLNTKQKKKEEFDCQNFEDFKDKVEDLFNIEPQTIKIMRPPTRDAQVFQKNLKEGLEIFFIGTAKKEKTEVDFNKILEAKKKEEEKMKQIQEMLEYDKLDDHRKLIRALNKSKIKERDFSYMNEDGKVQNLGTDHYTSVVHVLRVVPEFRKYCENFQIQPKNPDGLIIEELAQTFREIQGSTAQMINPLQWCSAFIAYCADDIEFPYPSYDFNYIVPKLFQTIHNAYITQAQRSQPNSTPNSVGQGCDPFANLALVGKTKLTPLDDDDYEVGKLMHKQVYKYVLECDLSDPNTTSINEGIRKRFEEKHIWQNFYAFDLEYIEKIQFIQRPSKFMFIHFNRIGYPPAKDESEEIVLLPNEKSTQKIQLKKILDLSEFCSNALNGKLENGKFERYQLFYSFIEQPQYGQYIASYEKLLNEMGFDDVNIMEGKYNYFDKKLYNADIFDEYYFQRPLKGSKQTGEYRLIGCVYHKGKYYHHPDPKHTKDSEFKHDMSECRGQFMVMVYKQNKQWLRFENGKISLTDLDEATDPQYWGGGQWTPVLGLYRQIYIKNIEIEYPE